MDNFSPAQYDRFEAYRRHALPKQAVRKVCFYILHTVFFVICHFLHSGDQ
jgi:hTAFII28-like protein conserved region